MLNSVRGPYTFVPVVNRGLQFVYHNPLLKIITQCTLNFTKVSLDYHFQCLTKLISVVVEMIYTHGYGTPVMNSIL